MAKKRSSGRSHPLPPEETTARPSLTAERFTRLHRLVLYVGASARTRDELLAQLGLDVRGFYRDLELLRGVGIDIQFTGGKYNLVEPAQTAAARLPYPDPRLTLGEMRQLSRGRSRLHQQLQEQIDQLMS
jgi:predicted DNA-binding transcriptional regulator YafY